MRKATKILLAIAAGALIITFSIVPSRKQHASQPPVEPIAKDLSGLADSIFADKALSCAELMRAALREDKGDWKNNEPTMQWAARQVEKDSCLADYHSLMETAQQVRRVESTGFAVHDMDIAIQLDQDRKHLAGQLTDFRSKYKVGK